MTNGRKLTLTHELERCHMALLSDEVQEQVRTLWADLEKPVTFHFHPRPGDSASDAMENLLGELADLSPQLSVRRHEGMADPLPPETASEMVSSVASISVDDAPTGVRFLGFPGGHEFGTMVHMVRSVSRGEPPAVSPETAAAIRALTTPLHLQVFVTYT